MPNVAFNVFWRKILSGDFSWNDDFTVRCLLVDNSSTYQPNKDHANIQQMKGAGLVEVATATGYKRGTVQEKTVEIVEINNNRIPVLMGGPVHFGAIEEGVTIKAVVMFGREGISDQDAVDFPIVYIDQATGLPKESNGGVILWNPGANGFLRLAPCP